MADTPDRLKEAIATLAELAPEFPGYDNAMAAAVAQHIATLLEFHHDDDADEQFADPIASVEVNGFMLEIKLESGRCIGMLVAPPEKAGA